MNVKNVERILLFIFYPLINTTAITGTPYLIHGLSTREVAGNFQQCQDIRRRAGQSVFDALWSKALPAEQRFEEIEEGLKPDFIETIS